MHISKNSYIAVAGQSSSGEKRRDRLSTVEPDRKRRGVQVLHLAPILVFVLVVYSDAAVVVGHDAAHGVLKIGMQQDPCQDKVVNSQDHARASETAGSQKSSLFESPLVSRSS